MFRIGDQVRVTTRQDDCDEQFPAQFGGYRGEIVKLEVRDVGASPRDPLYIVQLIDGSIDGFWCEELKRP